MIVSLLEFHKSQTYTAMIRHGSPKRRWADADKKQRETFFVHVGHRCCAFYLSTLQATRSSTDPLRRWHVVQSYLLEAKNRCADVECRCQKSFPEGERRGEENRVTNIEVGSDGLITWWHALIKVSLYFCHHFIFYFPFCHCCRLTTFPTLNKCPHNYALACTIYLRPKT